MLAKSLDDKITGILDVGSINPKEGLEIKFTHELDSIEGLSVFSIKPKAVDRQGAITMYEFLMNKLNQKRLQPEGFDKAHLIHEVEPIDFNVIYPAWAGSVMLPGSFKKEREGRQPLRLISDTIEGRRQEAYQRLESYGDLLTIKEIAEALGTSYCPAWKIVSSSEKKQGEQGKDRMLDLKLPKEEVKKYIDSHDPKPYGWFKRK